MDPIRVMEDMMNGRRDFGSLSPGELQHLVSPAARQEQLLHITVDVDVAPFYDAQGRLQNLHSIWVIMFGQTLVPPVEVRAAGKQALIGWVKTALRERAEALRKRLERDADASVEEVNTKHCVATWFALALQATRDYLPQMSVGFTGAGFPC